jgi:hypothetical protein
MEPIEGIARGAKSGERIVLYAKSGAWWVQPFSDRPFTEVRDSRWRTTTHLGFQYAALLVTARYAPTKTIDSLPQPGGEVLAVATTDGRADPSGSVPDSEKRIVFSGYDWDVQRFPTDAGGVMHEYRTANAWTDRDGFLHLKLSREGGKWISGEVSLTRSLGCGSYSFQVRGGAHFDPATVLGMFVWDDQEAGQNHREMDVEVSQWGDPAARNSQFVIQPYYVAANVFRFDSPLSAAQVHTFRWQAGSAEFKSETTSGARRHAVAGHVFTSGVPSPGGERVHINLYTYGKSRKPQEHEVEVVIEKFEYLP